MIESVQMPIPTVVLPQDKQTKRPQDKQPILTFHIVHPTVEGFFPRLDPRFDAIITCPFQSDFVAASLLPALSRWDIKVLLYCTPETAHQFFDLVSRRLDFGNSEQLHKVLAKGAREIRLWSDTDHTTAFSVLWN